MTLDTVDTLTAIIHAVAIGSVVLVAGLVGGYAACAWNRRREVRVQASPKRSQRAAAALEKLQSQQVQLRQHVDRSRQAESPAKPVHRSAHVNRGSVPTLEPSPRRTRRPQPPTVRDMLQV